MMTRGCPFTLKRTYAHDDHPAVILLDTFYFSNFNGATNYLNLSIVSWHTLCENQIRVECFFTCHLNGNYIFLFGCYFCKLTLVL